VLQVKPRAEPTTLYAKGKILGYKRYATQALSQSDCLRWAMACAGLAAARAARSRQHLF